VNSFDTHTTTTKHYCMSFIETIVDEDQTEVAEIRIDPITSHRSLHSKKAFRKNEVIIGFLAKEIHSTPNYLTVQIFFRNAWSASITAAILIASLTPPAWNWWP